MKFDDGSHYQLPCEYLRVFSPAADVRAARDAGELLIGKQGFQYQRAMDSFDLKITVNKQFVPEETLIKDGDEIAIVAVEQKDKKPEV